MEDARTNDPYSGVDLRRTLYFSLPIHRLSFRPVLAVRVDYLSLPAAKALAAATGALGGSAIFSGAALSWWGLLAVPGGVAVALSLQAISARFHIRARRPHTAAVVLAAAERAQRDIYLDSPIGMYGYVTDLAARVLRDPSATEEQRRHAAHLMVSKETAV